MTVLPNQRLFSQRSILDYLNERQADLRSTASQLSDPEILSQSVDDWVTELLGRVALDVPTIEANSITQTQASSLVPQHTGPNPDFKLNVPQVPGISYTFHIPYKGDSG